MQAHLQQFQCPNCGSDQLMAQNRGFDLKSAIVGDVIAGPVGILAGTIGSNDTVLTCLTCGNVFYPQTVMVEDSNDLVNDPTVIIDNTKIEEESLKIKQVEDGTKNFEAVASVLFFILGIVIIGIMLYNRFIK